MKVKIVPSAPFKNYADIEALANKANGKVNRIQIDVCDGKYVPSVSWPFTEYSKSDFIELKDKKDLDVFLPAWENISYSVDLMVENPEKYIESLVAYGIDEVVIHYRSITDWDKIVEQANNFQLNLVLAIDVKTDLQEFLNFARENSEKINSFQVMGIEKIGFQGQEFAEKSLEIVKVLKKDFPEKVVYFDGGINEETAEEIKEAGVEVFCVGSYLTKTVLFSENLEILKHLLH